MDESGGEDELMDQVEQLRKLHREGVLTDAEYSQALSRLPAGRLAGEQPEPSVVDDNGDATVAFAVGDGRVVDSPVGADGVRPLADDGPVDHVSVNAGSDIHAPLPTGTPLSIPVDASDGLIDEVAAKPIDTWAWALVAVPVVLLVFDLITGFASSTSDGVAAVTFVFAIALNFGLGYLDAEANPQLKGGTMKALAGLLVPVYLFKRAKIFSSTPVHGITWLLTFTFSILATLSSGAGDVIDAGTVERAIRAHLQDITGVTVQVDCGNDRPLDVGTSFICTATAPGERLSVRVTIENRQGDVTWVYL